MPPPRRYPVGEMLVFKMPEIKGGKQVNRSPRINPENCRKCGDCCKDMRVFYPITSSPPNISEMIRLHYMANVHTTISALDTLNGVPGYWLVFHHECLYLVREITEGHFEGGKFIEGHIDYSCGLIDTSERPMICDTFPYPTTEEHQCRFLDQL